MIKTLFIVCGWTAATLLGFFLAGLVSDLVKSFKGDRRGR